MKKYLLPILIALFLGAGIFYQWSRSEQQVFRLRTEGKKLEHDLWMIDNVRKNRPAIEEDIRILDTEIHRLESRVPSSSLANDFTGQLVAQLALHNIAIVLESSGTRERDFYREITQIFGFNGRVPEDSDLMEIFHKMGRLMRWEMIRPDNILVTRIYSTMFDMKIKTPVKRQCENGGRPAMNFWPFHADVRQELNQLREKCLQRNSGVALLVQVRQLDGRRKYKIMLEEIVKQLDINAGKQERMLDTQDSGGEGK